CKKEKKKSLIRLLDVQIFYQDQERREVELAELNSLEEKFVCAQRWKTEYRAYTKWERYIACDGSPDPTVLQEINTFMNLWREDQNEDIQFVMEKGEQVLNVSVKYKWYFSLQCVTFGCSLIEPRLAQAMIHLVFGSIHYYSDTGNMQTVIKDKNVTFCVWANLKKKNHVFCDTRHGFDLPKSLAVSSIAVRILHTHYDHVSPLWLQCQRVPRLEVLDSEELTQHSQDNTGEPEEEEKEGREEPTVTTKEETIADTNEVTEEETEKKSEILDVPPEGTVLVLICNTMTLLILNPSEEEEITEESTVDLQQFVPVGGVYHIDGLQLPPQVQQIDSWSVVEVSEETLHLTQPSSLPASESHSSELAPRHAHSLYTPERYLFSPVRCFHWFMQQGNQCMLAAVVVEEKNVLSHLVGQWMCPVTLRRVLKKCGLNIFPEEYSYKYVCVNKKVCTSKWSCFFFFFSTSCRHFLVASCIESAGIVVSGSLAKCLLKETEFRAYRQMALVTSAFAFGWSKWNLESDQDQVVFKVCSFRPDFQGQTSIETYHTKSTDDRSCFCLNLQALTWSIYIGHQF
uniref:Dynein axonemal intermediate chain 7 n=1 Tax=Pavo cristatus TaxID=9049 RepID=A0A8C9G145_PAVCR